MTAFELYLHLRTTLELTPEQARSEIAELVEAIERAEQDPHPSLGDGLL